MSASFPGSVLSSVINHEPPGPRSEPIAHEGEAQDDGESRRYAFVSGVERVAGDTVTIAAANGGGWARRAANAAQRT